MARALGHKHPTTVQAWYDNEAFPKWRVHEILQAARAKRLKLRPADLGLSK